ncbi:EF-hand domain-containing protein [Oleiharenicola sp. Vm1]|uniref:EF-hand domain-containing protein n=1 Tax=Oleiharenicola sp. Vm1 TaxID=3398393 RepID=UPI0039F55A11
MKNRLFIAAAAAALVFSTATFAQDAEHPAKDAKKKGGPFVKADKDGDGKLTEAEFVEFAAARMNADAAKARFKELDKDGNGSLTREEFAAGMPHKKKG